MTPELLAAKNVIIQGITGTHGSFHTRAMVASGTHIIAGTSPNKAGQTMDAIPVFATINDIVQAGLKPDASVIFVPAPFAKSAILEAITAKIPLIVCITEGIPMHDMLQIRQQLEKSGSRLIGPNCPGIIMPGVVKLGIIPAQFASPGSIAVVSRSGTLTYEAMAGLTQQGMGQKYVIGIGGDPIQGTSFIDCLRLFENDPAIDKIVMIGEIGGVSEIEAADYIAKHVSKPVYSYIAGHHAPAGVQLGHAGAILGSQNESASAKTAYLETRGIRIYTSITDLIASVVK
jgi:succinyl-CoA synthetase alpha subunit